MHRDVKPENILLERSTGRAIVTDFGIARADFNPSLTADGHVLGTVHYMSPEQSSGEPLDGRSDMYSLGCVGFFALSGRLPFEGQSPQAILAAAPTQNAASSHGDASTTVPTDAYRLRDVEAAAAEAGSSQRYVALALAELTTSPNAVAMVQPVPAWKDRLSTRMFGTSQRTLSVTRVFRQAPRVVLAALGRTLQAAPFSLSLRHTLGGHPLDGGVLVFDLPAMVDGNRTWTWTRYGVYVPEVRVTLSALPVDAKRCEVAMQVDLRKGLTPNIFGYGALAGGGGTVGGVIGGAIGAKALATDIFGEIPAAPPSRRSGGDDSTLLLMG